MKGTQAGEQPILTTGGTLPLWTTDTARESQVVLHRASRCTLPCSLFFGGPPCETAWHPAVERVKACPVCLLACFVFHFIYKVVVTVCIGLVPTAHVFMHVNKKLSDNYGNMISITPIMCGYNMIAALHREGDRKH